MVSSRLGGTRPLADMPTPTGQLVHLEFTSAFEMLDFVQVVSDHIGRGIGLDDDAVHWVGVAIPVGKIPLDT